MWCRRQNGDWLFEKEAEFTKWKELVPGQSPGGPHKSEVKEMILLHSHISQVTTEEGQSKITNTESVFKSSRKDAMIDNVEGSAQIQQSHNGDWARIWSGQEVTENTKETELESEAVRRSLKTRWRLSCLSTVMGWPKGVTKIVLIQITRKLVKNNFLN